MRRSQPELRPVVAPAVLLRRSADVVVALPAEARAGLAMRLREHAAQRGEVAAALQVEVLEQDEGLAACDAMSAARERSPRAQRASRRPRRRRRRRARRCLQEAAQRSLDARGTRAPVLQERLRSSAQPEVRRVFARLRRSTRMPMKARSNLLRQAAEACSRSATLMRTMRESLRGGDGGAALVAARARGRPSRRSIRPGRARRAASCSW